MSSDFESSFNPMSLAFVEGLYTDYVRDPNSVAAEWREYFSALGKDESFLRLPRLGPSFKPSSLFNPLNGHAVHAHGNGNGNGSAALHGGVSEALVRQD